MDQESSQKIMNPCYCDQYSKFEIRSSESAVGLVVEYIVAIDVTRVRFPDGAHFSLSLIFVGRGHTKLSILPLLIEDMAGRKKRRQTGWTLAL